MDSDRNPPPPHCGLSPSKCFFLNFPYLIQIWGGLTLRDTKKIQVLLNKCARVITGAPKKTRTRDLMIKCGWFYFAELVTLHSLLDLIKGHFPLIHQWVSMVIGDIPKTYQRVVNVFLLTIAVNGFIKCLSHKDFNGKGGVNVLFFSVLNC